jgi:hypothetical protein
MSERNDFAVDDLEPDFDPATPAPEGDGGSGSGEDGGGSGTPATGDTGDGGNGSGGEPDATQPAKPKKNPVQARIDELTREKYAYMEQAQRLQSQLAALNNGGGNGSAPQQPKAPDAPPKLDQYDTVEEWASAVTEYQTTKATAEAEKRVFQRMQQQQADTTFQQKAAAVAAKYPDYHYVAGNPTLPVTAAMADVIREMDNGPEVLYYLGKNPVEAGRIASAGNMARVALELAKIEGKLTGTGARTHSNAPKPETPVRKPGVPPDPTKRAMTPAEYSRWIFSQQGA